MAGLDELMHFLEVDLPLLAARGKTDFDRLAGASQGIVIYGCGKLGRKIATGLQRARQPAAAFSDANQAYWGGRQSNLTVFSPEEAAREFGRSHVFVVTVWRNYPEIKEHSLKQGPRKWSTSFPCWKHSHELLPNYNLHLPSRMQERRAH